MKLLLGWLCGACMGFLTGCTPETATEFPERAMGYRPVYDKLQTGEIKLLPPRSVHTPGKIYTYGNYLLINELNAGIHVFNNQNPTAPQPVAFIQLLGNTDMVIKDDVLYADHMGNLVALESLITLCNHRVAWALMAIFCLSVKENMA